MSHSEKDLSKQIIRHVDELRSQCQLHTIQDIDILKVREHLAVRPFGCGIYLWHLFDLLKRHARKYPESHPVAGFDLNAFWTEFKARMLVPIHARWTEFNSLSVVQRQKAVLLQRNL